MTDTANTIRRVADTVVGWGDGWEAQYIPEDDTWVCLSRDIAVGGPGEPVLHEIHITRDDGEWFVMVSCRTRMSPEQRWMNVSVSIRNAQMRKAIEYINRELDEATA